MKEVEIGEHKLEAHYDESPRDGFRYSIDAIGNSHDKRGQKFYPHFMKGINGSSFPDSVDLHVYDVKRKFRHIDSIWVRKVDGRCSIMNSMSLYYPDWELPESISNFVDRYVKALRKQCDIAEVEFSKDEYGYNIFCTVNISESEDIYSGIEKLEEAQEFLYRKLLIKPDKKVSEKYGEGRLHWWIRYVIVPLIGSGTIAAILANYLFK